MPLNFAPSLTQRSNTWTNFKASLSSKGGVLQYDDDGTVYTIYFYDGPEVNLCTIWKGTVPDGIIAGGYSQAQNDTDKTDFETNYKPSGNKRIQRTDNFGNPVVVEMDWATSFGLIPGITKGVISGYTATSATSGKAIRATAYAPQGANAQRSLNSTSANDTAAGTGARSVLVTYLNTSFQLKTETVTLNGTTGVNMVATDVAFIESLAVATVGTQGGGNVGTIQLWTGLAASGSVWASIAAADNQTYYAHHYVPSGVTCYLLNVHGGATVVAGAITVNRSGNPLNANAPQVGIGGTFPYLAAGSEDHIYRTPIPIVGPDLVWLVTRPNASTASTSYGTFEYVQF